MVISCYYYASLDGSPPSDFSGSSAKVAGNNSSYIKLLTPVANPFAIALANALAHEELLKYRDRLIDDNQFLNKELSAQGRNYRGDLRIPPRHENGPTSGANQQHSASLGRDRNRQGGHR